MPNATVRASATALPTIPNIRDLLAACDAVDTADLLIKATFRATNDLGVDQAAPLQEVLNAVSDKLDEARRNLDRCLPTTEGCRQ